MTLVGSYNILVESFSISASLNINNCHNVIGYTADPNTPSQFPLVPQYAPYPNSWHATAGGVYPAVLQQQMAAVAASVNNSTQQQQQTASSANNTLVQV